MLFQVSFKTHHFHQALCDLWVKLATSEWMCLFHHYWPKFWFWRMIETKGMIKRVPQQFDATCYYPATLTSKCAKIWALPFQYCNISCCFQYRTSLPRYSDALCCFHVKIDTQIFSIVCIDLVKTLFLTTVSANIVCFCYH